MILIADSGSTKTDWRLIADQNKIEQIRSEGINPYYLDEEDITKRLDKGLEGYQDLAIEKIYFYGAGCSSQENKDKMVKCFHKFYPDAYVEVDIDMLAAARALCGHEPGIACILGTGANSCLYDGRNIIENIPSLGFIMGDEGSGSYLGNKLLGSFMRNELPGHLHERLVKRYDLDGASILNNVYQGEMPIKYMASFSRFIFQNIKDPYCHELASDGFRQFLEKNVCRYTNYIDQPVHFTGSVAYYYANILRQVGADLGITIKHIVEGPIAGLVLYHQDEL